MESVCFQLQAEGHEVFFDKEDLPPGQGYNQLIRSAIENCDLFIFMITPESVAKGKYTLTELKIVIRKWPNPAGRVLPVMLEPTEYETIPGYLKTVTVLSPEGNLTAEIAMEVADLDHASVPVEPKTIEQETDLPTLTYIPLEIRFEAKHHGEYPISITDSPVGSLPAQPHPFESQAVELLLQASTLQIGESLRFVNNNQSESNKLSQPSFENAKKIGEQLYHLLFSSPVQACLKDSLKSIDPQRGKGLRFLINTTETPDLARLPWEFLYSPAQDDFLFTDKLKPVVRWLDVDQPTPSLLVQAPLRLLIAIASPSNKPELRVGEEIAHLDEALRDLVEKGLVEIQRLEHTTLELLDSTLLKNKPHILHFIGHGDFQDDEGMIILEANTTNEAEPISGRRLSVLLRNHLDSLRFVFLNSCVGATLSDKDPFGGVAQRLIQRGIPAVIAMQFPIPDQVAVSLARHFYRYLAAGLPVDAAITSTRAFLFAKGYDVEWGAPALYMRTPDGKLFDLDNSNTINAPFSAPPESEWIGAEETINKPKQSRSRRAPLFVLLLSLIIGLSFWVFKLTRDTPDGAGPPPSIVSPVIVAPYVGEKAAQIAENRYHIALRILESGNTLSALDELNSIRQIDPDRLLLSQYPKLRTTLADALFERAKSELSNGNTELSQHIENLLREIEPNLSQQLDDAIEESKQQAKLVDILNAQISMALSKKDLSLAQQNMDKLIKIAPEKAKTHELQAQIASLANDAHITTHSHSHKVVQGDSLSTIANSAYGDPSQWLHIYAANRDKIKNPNLIYLGQVLTLPILPIPGEYPIPLDQYRVEKGDSLWHIAAKAYGNPLRWLDIYAANRSLIHNPDRIFPNQILKIPNNSAVNAE